MDGDLLLHKQLFLVRKKTLKLRAGYLLMDHEDGLHRLFNPVMPGHTLWGSLGETDFFWRGFRAFGCIRAMSGDSIGGMLRYHF